MKVVALLTLSLAIASCMAIPKTTISVRDGVGAPIANFPLRVELSDGLRRYDLDSREDSADIRTNDQGVATIEYMVMDRQPAEWRMFFFGAKEIGNQSIRVKPLKNLSKGSEISVSFPNP